MEKLIQKVEDSLSSIFSKEDVLNLLKSYEPTYSSYVSFHPEIDLKALETAKIQFERVAFNDSILYKVTANSSKELFDALNFIATQNHMAEVDAMSTMVCENIKSLLECLDFDDAFTLSLHGFEIEPCIAFHKVTANKGCIREFMQEV